MKVNGLVYRIQDLVYVSLICPTKLKTTDGLSINEGSYKTLKNNQFSYVNVEVTDGTLDLEMDVYEFVNGYFTNFKQGDIFFNIEDLMTFTFENVTVEEMCIDGRFEKATCDIIDQMEEEKNKDN